MKPSIGVVVALAAIVLLALTYGPRKQDLPPLHPLSEPTWGQSPVTTTTTPGKAQRGLGTTTGPDDIDWNDPGVYDAIAACAYGEIEECG